MSGHRWLESSVSRINVVVQPDYRYINYIFKHHDQKNYMCITHQTWTKCIILRHPFYFTTLPNYDSRLKPSGSSRWSQRFSQALGFARLDSVSLLFASYIDDFSSLQYRYVRGWNMRYKCFHLFMDSQPNFYFICPTNPPASLCASRPTFSSEDLFTSVSETCMHHGAIRCCYLISLRTKMNRGVSSWNISVCFDYNIKSIVTDVEPMLGRRRRATSTQRRNDVGSTSHGRYRPNVGPTHVPL